jgi:hypothetical protein
MAKDTPPDDASAGRHKAALHEVIADYWEAYLRRTRWHRLKLANVLRLRRRIKIHRALAAKLRGQPKPASGLPLSLGAPKMTIDPASVLTRAENKRSKLKARKVVLKKLRKVKKTRKR